MASFQAKMERDRLRVIQKRKLSFRSIPTLPEIGISKKKKQKNKNHHNGFISSQNGTGQAEKDTRKKKLLF